MVDEHAGYSESLCDPADSHLTITPNDSTDLATVPRAIRINGAGDVVIRDKAGTDITYTCAAGEVLAFRGVRILSTDTTATGIVAWW